MAASVRDAGVGYPQLSKNQINTLIGSLMDTVTGGAPNLIETDRSEVLVYLINYYTKRWGLPEAITIRTS